MSDDNKLKPPVVATPQDDHATDVPLTAKAKLAAVPATGEGSLAPSDDHATVPKPFVLKDDHATIEKPF